MTETAQHLCDGLLLVEELYQATLTWAGVTYPCVGGPEWGEKLLGPGGFKLTSDVTVVVRVGAFPAGVGLPQAKQRVTYQSGPDATPRLLKIDSTTPIFGAVLILNCNNVSQGM